MKPCLDLLCDLPRDLGGAAVAGATWRDDLASHRSPVWWLMASLLATALVQKTVWVYFGSSQLRAQLQPLLAVAFCLFALFLGYNYSLVDSACPWHCIIAFPAAVIPAIQTQGKKKTSTTPFLLGASSKGLYKPCSVLQAKHPGLLAPDLCCYLLIKPNYEL